MASLNLYYLHRLHKRWRVSVARHSQARYETVEQAQRRRDEMLRKLDAFKLWLIHQGNHTLARQVERLRRRVEQNRSLASPIKIRRLRSTIVAHLWRFLVRNQLRNSARFITIIPRDWQYLVETLVDADPEKMLSALRSRLNRLGAVGANGFLFVGIDISYNRRHGVFQLHVHGFASGGLLDAVERLRNTPRFKSERCNGVRPFDTKSRENVSVVDPVQIKSERLTRLPYPLLYAVKQQFFAYTRVGDLDAGQQAFPDKTIPEPANSIALLWRDRWSLQQTTLMMGMRVGRDGFELLR